MSAEWNLIIQSLKWTLHKKRPAGACFSEINVPQLIKFANAHRVLPHVYLYLKDGGPALEQHRLLSEEILIHQKEILKKISLLLQISRLFDAHNIRHVSLKGPILSQLLYQDATMRMISDLDILIAREDAKKAYDLLERYDFTYPPVANISTHFQKIVRHAKDIVLVSPDKTVRIELHFELLPRPFLYHMDWDAVWQNRKAAELNGHRLFSMSGDMALFYLCAHGHQHGWERLYRLFDFACYYSKCFSENSGGILEKAGKYHLADELKTALLLSHDTFGLEIPKTPALSPKKAGAYARVKSKIQSFQLIKSQEREIAFPQLVHYWWGALKEKRWPLLFYLRKHMYTRWLIKQKPFGSYYLWLILMTPVFILKKLRKSSPPVLSHA